MLAAAARAVTTGENLVVNRATEAKSSSSRAELAGTLLLTESAVELAAQGDSVEGRPLLSGGEPQTVELTATDTSEQHND